MIRREPHRRVTHTDVGRLTRHEESMRADSDNWPKRVQPVIEFLCTGPKTRGQLHKWARRPDDRGSTASHFGVTMVEECLCWLEAHGRVERVDGKWRVK